MFNDKPVTILGDDIFFNFSELQYADIKCEKNIDQIRRIKEGKLDGFVARNVFSKEEVNGIISFLNTIPEHEYSETIWGKIFPNAFATVDGSKEGNAKYFDTLAAFNQLSEKSPELRLLSERINDFFINTANSFDIKIPKSTIENQPVAGATARYFIPGKGNLHVHCGHSHQEVKFYSVIADNMGFQPQLSFFLVLQNAENGGELTIYDLLWDNKTTKDFPTNNEYLIDKDGKRLYINSLRSFAIKPLPGDILVFAGGPIWHRVEETKGQLPRITFGGFLNFDNGNDTTLYYWS